VQLTYSAQKVSANDSELLFQGRESSFSMCSSDYSSNKTLKSHLSPMTENNNIFSHNYEGRSIFSNSSKSQQEDIEDGSIFEESQKDLKSLIEAEEELHAIWASAPKAKVCRPTVLAQQSHDQSNLRISPFRKSTGSSLASGLGLSIQRHTSESFDMPVPARPSNPV
jgi:hypothetical protein